jgi:murein DD-endopeptidase MepM/ murein hydrolase activator NlpD
MNRINLLTSVSSFAARYVPLLRDRHLLTKNNHLRLRYVVGGSAVFAVLLGMGLGHVASTTPAKQLAHIEPAAGLTAPAILAQDLRRDPLAKESASLTAQNEATAPLQPKVLQVKVGKGETLSEVLEDAGVSLEEAGNVVKAVSRHINPRQIRAGQKLDLRLDPDKSGSGLALTQASFAIDPLRTLRVERGNNGDLQSRMDEKPITARRQAARVIIDGSLYMSADKAGVPDRITANVIRLFSYTVDFQRDVKNGDKFEVLFDSYLTPEGELVKTGDIVFARIVLGGKEYPLYRFKTKDGTEDYFTPDGRSIRKSGGLMKTPVAFGRLTSGFGMRNHPVLGYTKMHKGVDFAAPIGTPVYAAADGVIEKAGRFSSYGNYIRIRHSSKLGTAYGHLSRYASGIRPGTRVKQGQVIGYVGNTGRSTGPHLHYEVLVNGVQVNPRSVKMTVDNRLKGDDLQRFREHIRRLGQEYVQNVPSVTVARNASN